MPACRRRPKACLTRLPSSCPEALRQGLVDAPFHVSEGSAALPAGIDLTILRQAIRDSRKLRITYVDAAGERTGRVVWPIALVYYVDVTIIAAWCELRGDYRHFRVDGLVDSDVLEDRFPQGEGRLAADWFARQQSGLRG